MLGKIKFAIGFHFRGRNHRASQSVDAYFADFPAAVIASASHTLYGIITKGLYILEPAYQTLL